MPIINFNLHKNKQIKFENTYTNITYGKQLKLSVLRGNPTVASFNEHALFVGGYNNTLGGHQSIIDAFDSNLTRTQPDSLTFSYGYPATSQNSSYVIFCYSVAGGSGNNVANAYNTSLTRSNASGLSYGRSSVIGTSNNNYALFAGGYYNGSCKTVDAYNTSLTRSIATDMEKVRQGFTPGSIGNYAMIMGGYHRWSDGDTTNYTTVETYNTSLTRSTAAELSRVRNGGIGISNSSYLVVMGGSDGAPLTYVDTYTKSLSHSYFIESDLNSYGIQSGASVGDYAFFAGINNSIAYDSSMVSSLHTALSKSGSAKGASTGNYALFAGHNEDYVDVYDSELNSTPTYELSINIPPFSKYKFTESTEQSTNDSSESKTYLLLNAPINGYIKPNANNYFTGQITTE